MKDTDLDTLAGEINAFVNEKTEPLAKGLEDVVGLVDELIQQPEPRDGKDGIAGEPGPQGQQGEQGLPGEKGEQGDQGQQGEQGEQGQQGEQGREGEQGEQGEQGDQGEEGAQGETGSQGEAGIQGEAGEKGVGIEVDVWEDRVYREGDLVQYHFGQYFRATKDTAQNPEHEDWARVGNSGFRFAGAHSDDAKFLPGDLYVKDYGCFLQTEKEARLIVGRGPKGLKGLKGKDGKDGIDGVDGAKGDSIVEVEVEQDQLIITTKTAGGDTKTFGADLGPVMHAAAEITKSYHGSEEEKIFDRVEETVKFLVGNYLHHAEDQKAVPVRFYRGLYEVGASYSAGDMITFGNEIYIAHKANKGHYPKGSAFESGIDYWFLIGGASSIGGSGSGSGGPDGGPVFTSQVLLTNPQRIAKDVSGSFNTQEDANKYFGDTLAEIEAIDLEGLATEDWVTDQLDNLDLDDLNQGLTQEQKIALIEAQIQFRGLMELDADDKPVWPADQTKDRGGWWAYPSSKFSNTWKYENLEWVFPHYGEDGDVTKQAAPKYAVGDIIQMQISDNEAGAGTSWRYVDTAPVFVEYKVEEIYYPDRLNGNANTGFPAYRVSKSAPDHRYTGSLPNVVKGPQGDPSDAWIQWHPTTFAFGAIVPDFVPTDLTDVEERLECIEDAMPSTGGVPSVPTGDLVLKITGSRPTGATGEAGKLLMWKAETGSGGNPYNEVKFPVDDVDAIDLDAPEVWFKQGDVVQKWTCGGGWFTNVNVLHISATTTEGDTLVDGLAVDMYYEDPTACFSELISRQESKDDDRRLQAEIEQIALGLETLLTQRTHGQWKYIGFSGDNIPRNAGEFALSSDDLSAAENIMTINLTDLNGTVIGLSDVEVGDYIEIVDLDEPDNYALFTCTKEPNGTGISDIELALKDKGQNFLVGETCEIRFFAVNEENINLAELDDRYLKLSGGEMATSAELSVNYIKPINLKHIQYSCDPTATHPEALMNRAMVQNLIKEEAPSGAPLLPVWELAHFSQGNMQPGKMAFCDGNLNGTDRLEAARGLVFSAIDANGNRVGRTKNGVDWERDFGGALNVLYDEEQTLLSMARSHGSAPAVIYYVAEYDAYMVIWPAEKDAVVTSETTHVVLDQSYKIHCPEIFF